MPNYSRETILNMARKLIGKRILELRSKEGNPLNKGIRGMMVEEEGFEYNANSRSGADFEEEGIELKVTPYKKNNNGSFSAKERLVLNIINYNKEVGSDFYSSSFWEKNEELLILFYLYDEEGDGRNDTITHAILHEFTEPYLTQIMSDWNFIHNKIISGEAHLLSEADTLYLGACTKGANSNSMRSQPNSTEPAKQRAYSLKTTYMTGVLRELLGNESSERIINVCVNHQSLEDYILDRVKGYFGFSQTKLASMFGLDIHSKHINSLIISRILNLKGRVEDSDEFSRANIKVKTIRVENDGRIIESMSFPTFKFVDIVNEDWEYSSTREYFTSTRFMLTIFKMEDGVYILQNIKFWNVPLKLIDDELSKVWRRTKDVVQSGEIVCCVENGKYYTNFPGLGFNNYFHVRPHGRNRLDTFELPVSDRLTNLTKYTKQCFWINSCYLQKVIIA
jgi:DNA mismatch repair protein MutH